MIKADPTSLVNDRFAAGREHLQLESILVVEGIADRVDRTVIGQVKRIVATLDEGSVSERLTGVLGQITREMSVQFARLVPWSYDQTVKLYATAIPRSWWRAEFPPLVFAEDKEPNGGGVPPLIPRSDLEPVTAKQNLSPAEYQKLLKEVVFPPPSEQQVRDIVLRPINGKAWPARVNDLSRLVTDPNGLADQLTKAYASGANLDDLQKMARPFTNNVTASARRIVRTEGLRIAGETGRAQYAKLGKMLQGAQIVATLDENTRSAHAARNGKIYWNVPGKTPTLAEMPSLPDEPNCRCYDKPVLTPPAGANTPQFQATFSNSAGKSIPDPSAYAQWFSNADAGRQKMAVGARRFDAVAKKDRGKTPTWFDFIGKDGELVPVDVLKGETAGQRQARTQEVQKIARDREAMFKQVSVTGFMPIVSKPKKPASPRVTPPKPAPTVPTVTSKPKAPKVVPPSPPPVTRPPQSKKPPVPPDSPVVPSKPPSPVAGGMDDDSMRRMVRAAIQDGKGTTVDGLREIGKIVMDTVTVSPAAQKVRDEYRAEYDTFLVWKDLSRTVRLGTADEKKVAKRKLAKLDKKFDSDAYILKRHNYGLYIADQLRKKVSLLRDLGGSIELKKSGGDEDNPLAEDHKKALSQAMRFLPRDWIERMKVKHPRGILYGRASVLSFQDRSFYLSGKIGVDSKSDEAVLAHELAHAVQKSFPDLNKMELEWRKSRLKPGEKAVRLKHDPGALVFEDEFTEAYIGRIYDQNGDGLNDKSGASEVLSMGIEGVFYGKHDILDRDLDMANFILGLLVAM